MREPGLVVLLPVKASRELLEKYRVILKPLAAGYPFTVVGLEKGLEQIETFYDDSRTAPLVAEKVVELWKQGARGVLVNCFNDPGVDAARELVPIPVIGAGYASMLAASLVSDTYAILTVGGSLSAAVIRRLVRLYGFESKVSAIVSMDIHVKDLINPSTETINMIVERLSSISKSYGVDTIVLGCTGFTLLVERLEEKLGSNVALIDPTKWGFLLLKAWVEAKTPNPLYRGGINGVAIKD